MAEKKSFLEFSEQIALETGVSKEDADRYLRALVKEMGEGILADGQVKVRGLGTFRVQWNEPRKSVDVRTGQETLIPGHNKLVYVADADLKEKVNSAKTVVNEIGEKEKPSASGDEPIRRLHEQAEEISMLLQGLGNGDKKDDSVDVMSVESAPVTTDVQEETVTPQEEMEVGSMVGSYDMGERELPVEKNRSYKVVEWLLIFLFVLLLVGALVYIEKSNHIFTDFAKSEYVAFTEWNTARKARNEKEAALEDAKAEQDRLAMEQASVASVADSVGTSTEDSTREADAGAEATPDSLVTQPRATVQDEKWSSAAEQVNALNNSMKSLKEDADRRKAEEAKRKRLEKKGLIGQEKLTRGKHMTDLALKYYGHKDFWIYIFEANKQRIPNPNDIKIGTLVDIPKMDETLVDPSSQEALQKAHERIQSLSK